MVKRTQRRSARRSLLPDLCALHDHELLEEVRKAIKAVASPDQLRRIWAPKRRTRKKRRA